MYLSEEEAKQLLADGHFDIGGPLKSVLRSSVSILTLVSESGRRFLLSSYSSDEERELMRSPHLHTEFEARARLRRSPDYNKTCISVPQYWRTDTDHHYLLCEMSMRSATLVDLRAADPLVLLQEVRKAMDVAHGVGLAWTGVMNQGQFTIRGDNQVALRMPLQIVPTNVVPYDERVRLYVERSGLEVNLYGSRHTHDGVYDTAKTNRESFFYFMLTLCFPRSTLPWARDGNIVVSDEVVVALKRSSTADDLVKTMRRGHRIPTELRQALLEFGRDALARDHV